MTHRSFRRLAAAAGLASATATAAAQIAPVVTVPLGDSANCPPYGYGATGYGYGAGGVVYDAHGGVHDAYAAGVGTVPARYPVERIPVQYLRYYPSTWYGLPGSTLPVVAPQVYMPTDTTQLGFYYQRVPTWVPVPGMIPGPPNPSMIHSYGAGVTGAALTDPNAVLGDGTVTNGTVTGERVISTRPVSTGGGKKTGVHTPAGRTKTDPGTVPTPPGGSKLPLQPPVAPAAEPAAFSPPPAPEPLLPVSTEDAI